jgi:peptidoglycan/xylan/chitin deacetylase (PgdA/CDA1 family)
VSSQAPDIDWTTPTRFVVVNKSVLTKVISTISDITNESNVDAILASLDYLGIKATFFVDGTADPGI